ncbi:MAG: hypothetical protein GY796_15480 [Chloroflexi bacterium]|nr:hypothetical protein [Chloroflexota bacterium]
MSDNSGEHEELPTDDSDTSKDTQVTLNGEEVATEIPSKDNPTFDKKRTRSIIVLQLAVAILLLSISFGYAFMHRVPHGFSVWIYLIVNGSLEGFNSPGVAEFNFVGVNENFPLPSFYSLVMEVFAWSFAGVLARSEYYLTQIAIRREEFHMSESISKIIGDTSMGVSIAIAVVAFLTATTLTIGQVELTLRTASIELIGAISFILGFYHEDTRRLLGSFQKKVSGGSD